MMSKAEIKRFLMESTPDVILEWCKNQATAEEKLIAASIMRQMIDRPLAQGAVPLNLMQDTAVAPTGSIMGIS